MNIQGSRKVELPNSEIRRVTSVHSGREYDLNIAWPHSAAPVGGFPVVYVLDGQSLFRTVVESIRTRSARTESTGIVPAIVVGIDPVGPSDQHRARRTYELTMTPPAHGDVTDARVPHTGSAHGGGIGLLSFICNEVKPAIAQQFQTDASRQTLLGHSLGALCVVEVLIKEAAAFDNYVVLSPSIWWDAERVFNTTRALTPSALTANVYMAVGEFEEALAPWQQHRSENELAHIHMRRVERAMISNTRTLKTHLTAAARSPHHIVFDLISGEDHASMVPVALSRALRFVLSPR